MPPASERAVFLSYASQDADAARRICEALRAAGVEVWFDQNELVGGDAWDAKIRKQIKDCTLFVPIISASTQARTEGYFRLEWRLADQRTHLMAKGRPFLLPVVIDETRDSDAHVPDSFLEVQWTRLAAGDTPPNFCSRVQKLLGGDVAGVADPGRPASTKPATTKSAPRRMWLIPAILGVAALVVWQPWRQKGKPAAPAPVTTGSSETARIRARLVPDQWQKGDFEALSPTLDRIIQANQEDSDAWALRSIINSLQVMRNLDSGTKPLEAGKAAAERALRLTPASPLAELALGLHLVAMISRGGDPQAGPQHVARALATLPPDALTRYADLVSVWLSYNIERSEQSAKSWLAAEPGATFPAWILAQSNVTQRRPVEAEKWAETAAADQNITGTRAFYTLFETKYYLRADLAAAKATLARIAPGGQAVHRVVHGRWLMAMADGRWDEALQQLAQLPEPMLYDRPYHGPRALLAGLAHQRAGRADAALAQFREAERLLRSELASDADNEELHSVLAVTLACAGRPAEARSELALVEPLVKGQTPSVYRGALIISIAQTYGVLGDFGRVAEWLRKLFVEQSGFPFTPASFRLDPRFSGTSDAPELQALLKEFSSLDQRLTTVAADQKSVAVLAFANLSDDKEAEFFSDGVSEELLTVLGRVPGLRVAAPMSAFSFKGKKATAQEIGQKLNVAYLVNGSVRRAGTNVVVVARLNRVDTDEQIWTEKFSGETKDVFALQEAIAGKIAKELSLKLGASSTAATASVNPQAFELYVQARQAWSLRTPEGYDRAESLLQQVIAIAPDFARAHAALSDVWLLRGADLEPGGGTFAWRNSATLERARAGAEKAVTHDSTSAEALTSLSNAKYFTWKFDEAVDVLRRAIALNPNYASAHQWLGDSLVKLGRIDEGLAELAKATELDPLSFIAWNNFGSGLLGAGKWEAALAAFDRAQSLSPSSVQSGRARALVRLGRVAEAVPLMEKGGDRWHDEDMWRAEVLDKAGRRAEAEKLIGEAQPERKFWGLVTLGRADAALAALRPGSFNAGSASLILVMLDPIFDPIRRDSRFVDALATVGLTEAHTRAQAWRAAHPAEKPAKK